MSGRSVRVSKRKGVIERANEKFDVVLHTTQCCHVRAMKRHYSVTCNASFRQEGSESHCILC